MRQGKPDNLNVHNCNMSVPTYGAAIECEVRCVEISQLYDLIISSNPAIAAFSLSSSTLGICFSFIAVSARQLKASFETFQNKEQER